jgi:hypothetical protein
MIHDEIMFRVQDALEDALIDGAHEIEGYKVGVVKLGNLDGEPDPDEARISITLHENDPDQSVGGLTESRAHWMDEVDEVEIGGVITWKRRFTVKTRVLLDFSRENLGQARYIASMVRSQLESALLDITFSGIEHNGEYVSRNVISDELQGEMLQGGGPPDSYDFSIKIRFSVLTTTKPRIS